MARQLARMHLVLPDVAKVSSTYIIHPAAALPALLVVWPLRPPGHHWAQLILLPTDGALQQQQWNLGQMCPRTLSYPCGCFVFLLVCSQAGWQNETERPKAELVCWWQDAYCSTHNTNNGQGQFLEEAGDLDRWKPILSPRPNHSMETVLNPCKYFWVTLKHS